MTKIILYTIKDCPLCTLLEQELQKNNITYKTCTNRRKMMRKGFTKAPMLEIYNDDQVETLTFIEAMLRFGDKKYAEQDN